MFPQQIVVIEVCSVIELSKLEYNLNHLWLVCRTQAVMFWSAEYTLYAFVDHLWAYGVLLVIQALIEIWVLFRHNDNCFVCLDGVGGVCLDDCVLDIRPNIWSVVAIQEDDLLQVELGLTLVLILSLIAVRSYCIKVVLVCLVSDDINRLMHANSWVCCTIFFTVLCQYTIIWNFQEFNLYRFNHTLSYLLFRLWRWLWFTKPSPFIKVLNLRERLLLLHLNVMIKPLVKICLTGGT